MQSKRIFYFILSVALMGLACGIGQGFSDFNIPFVPTKTNTLPPPNTPTVTPTYPPKLEGTSDAFELDVLENESSVFTDKRYGYRLRFPAEWLVIPLDEEGAASLFDEIELFMPEDLLPLLETTRQDTGVRVMALDYAETYSSLGDTIANIVVTIEETTSYTDVEMVDLLDESVEEVPTLVPGSSVTYQAVQTNPNGVEYGKMLISHPEEIFGVSMKQIIMMVKIEDGLLVVTGSVLEEFYLEVENVFQRVFDSLEFTE